MTSRRLLPGLAVLAVPAAAHLMLYPRVADPDAFYHLGHATRYLVHGPLDTSFPWARFSVIGDLGADLWWGFHVLLMPFAALGITRGIQVAGLAFTATLMLGVWWVCVRHRTVAAWLWPIILVVAVPNVLFRFVMVRPHVLSSLAAVLLLSCLVRGRWVCAAGAAAFIAWVHLSLFWLPLLLVAAYLSARALDRALLGTPEVAGADAADEPEDAEVGLSPVGAVGAVVVGLLTGWLARPRPLATLELVDVQLFALVREKAKNLPIAFAVELTPMAPDELMRTSWFFSALWVAALLAVAWAVLVRRPRVMAMPAAERRLLWSSLLLSVGFFALTILTARRAQMEWVVFGSLALPLTVTYLGPKPGVRTSALALVAIVALPAAWTARRHALNVEYVASDPDLLGDVARWLAAHSEPGDMVYHTRWDNFAPLFARNRVNRYIGGMDPIFQYVHDPRLYWEHFYLSGDAIQEYTCDAYPCAAGTATDTYEVIRSHFGARWVLVQPRRNPKFARYLLDDPRYTLALETPHEAVFEVQPAPEAP